jgi:tRNA (Thr-GGU) A37 N-methylase
MMRLRRLRRSRQASALQVAEGQLRVAGVDVLDGTPLLDIKP